MDDDPLDDARRVIDDFESDVGLSWVYETGVAWIVALARAFLASHATIESLTISAEGRRARVANLELEVSSLRSELAEVRRQRDILLTAPAEEF